MIRDFRVQGFKKFNDLKVTGLERLTVIGGMNNVGKTSFLEAVLLLFDRLNPGMLVTSLARRGLTRIGGPESPFASSFYDFDPTRKIVVEACEGSHSWKTEISQDPKSKVMRVFLMPQVGDSTSKANGKTAETDGEIVLKVHYYQDGKDLGEVSLVNRGSKLELEDNGVHGSFERYAMRFLDSRNWPNQIDLAEHYSALDLQGESGRVMEVLKIIEPKINSVTTVAADGSVSLFVDVGLGRKIPVPLLGDGTNRILSLVIGFAQARNGILFVDELDNGLHYSVLRELWKKLEIAAKYFNCQVIATTHSYGLLQAAIEGFGADASPEFCYVRLQDSPKGVTATRYAFSELSAAIREGWEVR